MRDRKLINRYKIFGKAMIADAKGLPAPGENPGITEDSIINSASRELCKTPEDIKKSETMLRFIALTEQRAGDVLNFKNSNISALNVYGKLVIKMPMTQKERNYLLGFLNDDKSKKIAQDILSKLNLIQGDENSEFIQSFLKNSDGKLDISLFVEYLINELEEYKLIIPDNTEDIKKIENGSNNQLWDFYEYKIDGKKRACVVFDGKIFFIDRDLESVKLLNNGLIFCVRKVETKDNEPTEELEGFLGQFNFVGVILYKGMEGIIDMQSVNSQDFENAFFTRNSNGKNGLMEIKEENKKGMLFSEFKIKELLPDKYNEILTNGKFITTVKYGDENKLEEKNRYEALIKKPDGLKLIANLFSKEDFEIEDLGDNLVLIRTDDGDSLLKFNEKESRLEVIDSALMNMDFINIINLLSGKPTAINKENGNSGVYIFDKKTGKLDVLISGGEWHAIEGDFIVTNKGKKHILNAWKNGVLYKLKDGYKYVFNYGAEYIKKGFFGNYIYIEDDFEEMKEFLEPINKNLLPIDLKSI